MARQTAGYRNMSGAQREEVDGLLQGRAFDAHFCESVVGLLASPGYAEASADLKGDILAALREVPEEGAVDRLRFLAEDAREWFGVDAREQESLVERAAKGTALTGPQDIAFGSNVRRQEGPGLAHEFLHALPGGAVHVAEAGLEIGHLFMHGVATAASATVVEGAAAACAVVGVAAFVIESVEGVRHAHHEGAVQRQTIARGQAFVAAFDDLVANGEIDRSYARAGDLPDTREARSEGALAANRVWTFLDPAQRAQLRAMTGEQRQEFHDALHLRMEQLTIGGSG